MCVIPLGNVPCALPMLACFAHLRKSLRLAGQVSGLGCIAFMTMAQADQVCGLQGMRAPGIEACTVVMLNDFC